MMNPEILVALSYFDVYTRKGQHVKSEADGCDAFIRGSEKRALNQVDNQTNDDDHDDEQHAFWVEDVWTEHDAHQAETLLQSMTERCRINPSQSVPGNHRNIEQEAVVWDRFYGSHQTNFFKDRHYLATAFPEEFGESQAASSSSRKRVLVEVGCGVGNALLPLLEEKIDPWTVYGLDLSSVAIELLHQDPRFQAAKTEQRAWAWPCDISMEDAILWPCRNVATVSSLLFCLSAVAPDCQGTAAKNTAATLQPGGVLIFRDYGRYDEAQLKLGRQRHKLLQENFYRKHDGTKCYYFTTDELTHLFVQVAGLELLEIRYIRRAYQNRSTGTSRRRVWVQGRFRKPFDTN